VLILGSGRRLVQPVTMHKTAATSAMIARIIKGHRRRINVSQEHLAHLANVDRTYVGKLERGILNPTIYRLNRVLSALGVTWKHFGETLDGALLAENPARVSVRKNRSRIYHACRTNASVPPHRRLLSASLC
jgi:transcriptional regulator with XRE-family HTH domain